MIRPALPVALATVLACTHGPPPETPPAVVVSPITAPELDVTTYFPVDTVAVVGVDMARLFSSPYAPWFVREVRARQEGDAASQALLEVLASLSMLHVPVVERRGRPRPGAVFFESSLSAPVLEERAATILAQDDFGPYEVAGLPAFGDDRGAFVNLAGGWWLVGPRDKLTELLASPRRQPPTLADPDWIRAGEQVSLPAPTVVARVRFTEMLRAELAETPVGVEGAAPVQFGAVALDAADGVQLRGALLGTDAGAANALVARLNALQQATPAPEVPEAFRALSDALQLRAEGGDVLLSATLTDETVRGLYAFGQTLFNLRAPPLTQQTPPR